MRKYLIFSALIVLGLAGCTGKPSPEQTASSPAPKKIQVDPATAGSISGTVQFKGAVPKPASIDMAADPACKGQNASEEYVVRDGKLANVLVHLKGAAGFTDAGQQTSVVVTQEGCRYVPHVVALAAGGTVKFLNADDTMHNIHPMPRENKEWNAAQMSHGELEKKFPKAELMIPVKCNQHPWMKMYVNVMDSPFYVVTGLEGKFEIKGVPPGKYTIEAVHETMGAQTQEITIAPKQAANAEFTFAAQKGAAAAK